MKKILIFSSTGGGGQTSTEQSIQSALGAEYGESGVGAYEVVVVEMFRDVFFALKERYCPVAIYNRFAQHNNVFMCNLMGKLICKAMSLAPSFVVNRFYACATKENPDLIISVVPYMNCFLAQVAERMNIPFLIVSSDINIHSYVANFKRPISGTAYRNMYVALPFESEINKNKLKDLGVLEDRIFVVGASVRESFLRVKNVQELKEKWGVSDSLPVILLMMGAQGARSVVDYCQQLAQAKTPVHLMVCIGKNIDLKFRIDAISFSKNIHVHIVEFTPDIAELMAIADLFITKSGSNSVCEALYSELPILLDAVSPTLALERFNHEFVAHQGFGELLVTLVMVAKRVDYLLAHPEILAHMRLSMRAFKKKNSQQEIPTLIERIMNNASFI